MDLNKKRVFIIMVICTLLIGMFMLISFTDVVSVVKGKISLSLAKEGDMELDLIEDASLRKKPNFSSKIIGTIKKGTHVEVLAELNKWVKITDGTNEGWVIKQNVVTIETENVVEPGNEVVNEPVTNEVVELPKNEVSNNVVDKPDENVSNNTTENESSTNVGKKGVINVDTAKVREKPDGKLLGLVDLNDEVEILGEEGDWYKVNVDEYKNCYIAKRLVTIK